MRAFLIDDDTHLRETLGDLLRWNFPELTVENVGCALDFELYFEAFAASPPEFVVLDIMMPWSPLSGAAEGAVGANINTPVDFDPFRAGMHILKRMSDDQRTCRVPIVILSAALKSVLRDGAVLPTHVIGIDKAESTGTDVVEAIKAMTFGRLTTAVKPLSTRIIDAIDAKPGWFGITFDLKKLKL